MVQRDQQQSPQHHFEKVTKGLNHNKKKKYKLYKCEAAAAICDYALTCVCVCTRAHMRFFVRFRTDSHALHLMPFAIFLCTNVCPLPIGTNVAASNRQQTCETAIIIYNRCCNLLCKEFRFVLI